MLVPAFDFLNGQLSRLHQGEFDSPIDYDHIDPFARIEQYVQEAGVTMIHLVNLDASLNPGADDKSAQRIIEIIKSVPENVIVDVGGGIRGEKDIARWCGVRPNVRVSLGTWVFRTPSEDVEKVVKTFGSDRLSVDLAMIENGMIGVKGWTESGGMSFDQAVEYVFKLGFRHAIVTDKSKDNSGLGPNCDIAEKVMQQEIYTVISGGVGNIEHLKAIVHRFQNHPKKEFLEGVITGQAQLKDPELVKRGQEIFF